jgi:8-oxo-dGTP diphosphatase
MQDTPNVGVAAVLVKDEKLLLGKRKNAHGNGTWAFPGGHLEHGEEIMECARREVREETGLQIHEPEIVAVTNDIFSQDNHYITVFVQGTTSGSPELREPEKCHGWDWFNWNDMPQPLFLPIKNLHDQDFHPFA